MNLAISRTTPAPACLFVVVSSVAACGGSPCEGAVGAVGLWHGDGDGKDAIGGAGVTAEGGAAYAPGAIGEAFALDGSGAYFSAPDHPSLNPTDAVTVTAWVYRQAAVWIYDPIVKKSGEASGYALEFGDLGVQDELKFWVYLDGLGWAESTSAPVAIGAWTHVAGVYDGAAVRLYLNGVEVATKAASGSIIPSDAELEFGGDPSNTSRHYSGLIDEITIYGRALTAREVGRVAAANADACP